MWRLPRQHTQKPSQKPASRSRDVLGEVLGKSVVNTKELPVEQVNRMACFLAAAFRRGRNVDLNATLDLFVGFDGP